MKRLSLRERVLLVLLVDIAAVSAYVLLFYIPTSQRMDALHTQIATSQELESELEARLTAKRQMEQELARLPEQKNQPLYMPVHDNLQAVMVELNAILAETQEYSLFFQGDQGEENVFCRQVSIPFTCGSYEQAREILQKLHDSPIRGTLGDTKIAQQENGTVRVTAVMLFFEYQAVLPD